MSTTIERIEVNPETAEERHTIFEKKVRELVEKVRTDNRGVTIQKLDNLTVLGETGEELEVDVAYAIRYVHPDLLERRLREEFRKFSIKGYSGRYTYMTLHTHTDPDSTKCTESEMIVMLVKGDKDNFTFVKDCKEEPRMNSNEKGIDHNDFNARIKVRLNNSGVRIWANKLSHGTGTSHDLLDKMKIDEEGYAEFGILEFIYNFGKSIEECGIKSVCEFHDFYLKDSEERCKEKSEPVKEEKKELNSSSLEGLKETNLNSQIKVKLTNKGIAIWTNYIRDTDGEKYGIRPTMDAEGYSKFTLWEFMHIFGKSMFCGSDPVCSPNSIFV